MAAAAAAAAATSWLVGYSLKQNWNCEVLSWNKMNWQAVSNFTTPYRSFHPNNGDKLANVKTFREKKTRQGVDGTDAAARISSCFFFLVFLFFFLSSFFLKMETK